MAAFYQKFLKTGLDLAPLGLTLAGQEEPYFCTPRGARVFAQAGTDGIHYCFVRGFDQMVFAVSPMNEPGDYVHPLARSFEDFLRLLLGCGSADALEQAHGWTRDTFAAYVEQLGPDEERSALEQQLQTQLGLAPIRDPYGYVRAVQVEFDYSRIPFTRAYREEMALLCPPPEPTPPWRVYYQGGLWGSVDGERPGQELRLEQPLAWGADWQLPAVYLCRRGLCALVVRRAEGKALRAYEHKWMDALRLSGGELSQGQELAMEAENPLAMGLTGEAVVNGKTLACSGGCGTCWRPPQEGEEPPLMARSGVEHFGLDPAEGWAFELLTFPWVTARRPKWQGCTLTLRREALRLPGPVLTARAVGDTLELTHPRTGEAHRLTVTALQEEQLDPAVFRDETMDFPTHLLVMEYTVEPPMGPELLDLQCCTPGDRPRRRLRAAQGAVYGRHKELYLPEAQNDALVSLSDRYGLDAPEEAQALGIIGGADGPTAVCVGCTARQEGSTARVANSNLHFEPVHAASWQLVYSLPQAEPVQVQVPARAEP